MSLYYKITLHKIINIHKCSNFTNYYSCTICTDQKILNLKLVIEPINLHCVTAKKMHVKSTQVVCVCVCVRVILPRPGINTPPVTKKRMHVSNEQNSTTS